MAEQWIIRVQGKEYGPADLATLREWKADGRVLPANPARQADVNEAHWKTAGDIPGLFRVEPPPVPDEIRSQKSEARNEKSAVPQLRDSGEPKEIGDQKSKSRPPSRNILV